MSKLKGQFVAQRLLEMGARHRVIGLLNEEVFFGPDFELVGGHIEIFSTAPLGIPVFSSSSAALRLCVKFPSHPKLKILHRP